MSENKKIKNFENCSYLTLYSRFDFSRYKFPLGDFQIRRTLVRHDLRKRGPWGGNTVEKNKEAHYSISLGGTQLSCPQNKNTKGVICYCAAPYRERNLVVIIYLYLILFCVEIGQYDYLLFKKNVIFFFDTRLR